jgi:hypothetical protein
MCAIVFWSAASAASDNVRHEATVAKQQGKLIAALLEPLTAAQFPMGMYTQQAANLVDWGGDLNDPVWGNLRREVENKLVPRWMQQRMDELEAELLAERGRREAVQSRNKALQIQISKEAQGHLDLRDERDKAIDEVVALRATVQQLNRALSEAEKATAQQSRRANEADSRRQAIERRLEAALRHAAEVKSDADANVSSAGRMYVRQNVIRGFTALSTIILIALIVTGALYVLRQRQAVTTPLSSASRGSELPSRGSAESAPSGRVAAPLKSGSASTESANPTTSTSPKAPESPARGASDAGGEFTLAQGMEANGAVSTEPFLTSSIGDCKDQCVRTAACGVFSYSKLSKRCYLYETATLSHNEYFDTGTRASGLSKVISELVAATRQFTISQGMEANGTVTTDPFNTPSIADCEDRCVKTATCGVFSYSKLTNKCYLYKAATLSPNAYFDTGKRK